MAVRRHSPNEGVPWRPAAFFAAGLAVVLGLNAARNLAVSGHAVAIASHGGLNFYIGNHAGADGTYSPVPGIRPSIAGQATDSERVAEASFGRPLSPSEVSSYFYGLGWSGSRRIRAPRRGCSSGRSESS